MFRTGLSYDDVCLIPKYNNVSSRTEPDVSTLATQNFSMRIPIFAANMDTVIGDELASVLISKGSYPILHRFATNEEIAKTAQRFPAMHFLSTGVGMQNLAALKELVENYGIEPLGVCIDIAHGHSVAMIEAIKHIRSWAPPEFQIIAGNVCTADAVGDLASAGADAVKVGIGPGSACTTRKVTAFGRAQFSAVYDCAVAADRRKIPLIADGGIKSSREIVLALAAGASSVMVGGLFAKTHQAAGKGRFRGQASAQFQQEYYGAVKAGTVPEGKAMEFTPSELRDAGEVIDELIGGLRSGMTYAGARNIEELQRKAEFECITPNYF